MRWLAYAAIAAFLAGSAPAPAEVDLPPGVTDGLYVTVEEIRANSSAVYDAFAGPEGGPISREDFVARDLPDDLLAGERPDREVLEGLFGALDRDGDGQVTRAEWDRRIEAHLGFADENQDGRITLKELANARENLGIGEALGMIF